MSTLSMDTRNYLKRHLGMVLPEDMNIPTPLESRAISKIHRCRRMHSDLIEYRFSDTYDEGTYYRSRSILVDTIRMACETIRSERKLRGW